jgi:hypothetical protein
MIQRNSPGMAGIPLRVIVHCSDAETCDAGSGSTHDTMTSLFHIEGSGLAPDKSKSLSCNVYSVREGMTCHSCYRLLSTQIVSVSSNAFFSKRPLAGSFISPVEQAICRIPCFSDHSSIKERISEATLFRRYFFAT